MGAVLMRKDPPFDSEYFYATPTVAYGRVFIGNADGSVTTSAVGSREGERPAGGPAAEEPGDALAFGNQ